MAPAVGLEPTTNRLTADRSTTELRWIISLDPRRLRRSDGHIPESGIDMECDGIANPSASQKIQGASGRRASGFRRRPSRFQNQGG